MELNERAIKAAQPGDILRDSDITGLHLRVFKQHKGRQRKSFYLYFRTKAGVERRPKLGDHGAITLTQARKVAQEMLAQVAMGGDPGQDRLDARAEASVNELWAEYWKRHGSKKKSAEADERLWNLYLKPRIGTRRLSDVTYRNMADLHESLADKPVQANRVLALASKMFNFAYRPLQWMSGAKDNPCKGVSRNKERKRRRKGSREEIAALVAALRQELDGPNLPSAAFLWLLLTTGARKGEIAAARHKEIQGNRLLLDEHKTDDGGYARVIYLPPVAMDVIALLPKTNGTLTGLQNPKKLWDRIRTQAGCPDLTMHDLRRTFASVALSTGQISLEQVMQMLGHTNAQTTKVYAWLMEDAATEAVGMVADRLMLPT